MLEEPLGYDPVHRQVRQPRQRVVYRALGSHWVTVVVIGLLVSMTGGSFAMLRPHQYTSHTEVLLQPLAGNAFSPDMLGTPQEVTVGLETEASLVSAPDVTARASKAVGNQLRTDTGALAADVVLNSQILQISYTASSPEAAQRGVTAYASALLAARQARARSVRDHAVSTLEREIASLRKQLDAAGEAAIAAKSTAADAARLQLLTSRMVTFQEQLGATQAISTTPGSIVGAASAPGFPDAYLPYALVMVAILIGFSLGLIAALVRVWIDDRIDPRYDVSVAGVPIWADLGRITDTADAALTNESTAGSGREAYRRLRAAIVSNVGRSSIVAIASQEPLPQVGGVAANIALSLNESGYRARLVDSEFDHPRVAELLGLSPGPGLSDVMRGEIPLDEAMSNHRGVSVLTAGPNPGMIKDRYSGKLFSSLVETSRLESDYTFITADLSTGIGSAIASIADCVVVISVGTVTTHQQISDTLDRLWTKKIRIAGIVNINFSTERHRIIKKSARDPLTHVRASDAITRAPASDPAASYVYAED